MGGPPRRPQAGGPMGGPPRRPRASTSAGGPGRRPWARGGPSGPRGLASGPRSGRGCRTAGGPSSFGSPATSDALSAGSKTSAASAAASGTHRRKRRRGQQETLIIPLLSTLRLRTPEPLAQRRQGRMGGAGIPPIGWRSHPYRLKRRSPPFIAVVSRGLQQADASGPFSRLRPHECGHYQPATAASARSLRTCGARADEALAPAAGIRWGTPPAQVFRAASGFFSGVLSGKRSLWTKIAM